MITISYRAMVALCYFEDGIALKRRTVEFRMRFNMLPGNATGFGHTIPQADKPRAGHLWRLRTLNLASRIGKFCIKWRQGGALLYL